MRSLILVFVGGALAGCTSGFQGTNNYSAPSTAASANSGTQAGECLTIESFGGAGDGVTDNTPAYNSFWTATGGKSACLAFGAGTYAFNTSGIAQTLAANQAITVMGVGSDVTTLYWPSTNNNTSGLEFDFAIAGGSTALHVHDLSVVTNAATTGFALKVNGAEIAGIAPDTSDFINLVIKGATQSQYWGYGIFIQDTSTVTVTNVSVTGCGPCTVNGNFMGIGIEYRGTSSQTFPTGLMVSNTSISFENSCVDVEGYTQGIMISQSQCVDAFNGYYINSIEGAQCSIIGSEADVAETAILISDCGGGSISNNWLSQGRPGFTGNPSVISLLNGVNDISIDGNWLAGAGAVGGTAVGYGMFCGSSGGNFIYDNAFAGFLTDIILSSSCVNTKVTDNSDTGSSTGTTTIANSGSNDTLSGN